MAKGLPWFRMYAEFATDPKVQRMSESNQRRLLMLLCMRCSNGDVTLHDSDIAFQMRISEEEWEESKSLFIEKTFIDEDNNVLNWEKRQFASDSSAERVSRHREHKKQSCNVTSNADETKSNALDTDTDTDTEQINKKSKSTPVDFYDVPESVISDFKKLRKEKKAAITQTAIDGIKREADKLGIPLADALSLCCVRGWQGFNADWVLKDQPNARGSPYKSRQQETQEWVNRLIGKSKNERPSDIIDV